MLDYLNQVERLLQEADECELISKLSADDAKAAHFADLAARYRAMANDLRQTIKAISLKPPSLPPHD